MNGTPAPGTDRQLHRTRRTRRASRLPDHRPGERNRPGRRTRPATVGHLVPAHRHRPRPLVHPLTLASCMRGPTRDTIRQLVIGSNSSHRPIADRLAMSGEPPAFSAVTYLPLMYALRLTLPSGLATNVNTSHEPTAPRLAINGEPPAFSAVTYLPLACAYSAIIPPPRSTSSNC